MGGGLSLSLPPTPTASQTGLTTPRSDAPNRLSGTQVSYALPCSSRESRYHDARASVMLLSHHLLVTQTCLLCPSAHAHQAPEEDAIPTGG